jgi:hypothetical protein
LAGQAFVGLRLHDNLAVEAGFQYFGTARDDDYDDAGPTDHHEAYGASLSALGILPAGQGVEVFLRGGLMYGWLNKEDDDAGYSDKTEQGISPIVGTGADLALGGGLFARAELQWVPNIAQGNRSNDDDPDINDGAGDLDVFAAMFSVAWKFGQQDEQGIDLAAAMPAHQGFYLGAGPSFIDQDGCEWVFDPEGTCADNVTAFGLGGKAFAGYRFHPNIAVEGSFNYFGVAEDDDDSDSLDEYESYGVGLAVLGILPVNDRVELFAKAGAFYGWLDERDNTGVTVRHLKDSGLSPLLGGGVNVAIGGPFSIRGEVEWIPNVGGGEADPTSLDNAFEGSAGIDVISASLSLVFHFD